MATKILFRLAGVAILLSISVPLIATEQERTQPSASHSKQKPILLNQDSWTDDEERQQWYHTSAGTQLMPFDWFMALNDEPFRVDLQRTGVLSDPSGDDLAVGFAKTSGVGVRAPQLGLTCSFCHTTEFAYQGKTFRIDGGPSLQYNAKFVQGLARTLGGLKKNPERFKAFATAVFQRTKQAPTTDNQAALADNVATFTQHLLDRAGRDPSPGFWGPGRFDALGRGGNLIFSQLSPDNLRPANAPASIPALWGAWEYDRVQWGGSIRHPLARNIAQVIGVNANIFTSPVPPFDPQVDQTDPFRSSVDVPRLKLLENLARKLRPPLWPPEFPPIDRERAKLGRDLYWGIDKQKEGLCAHCHNAQSLPTESETGPHLKVTVVPQREIGTDPLYLNNFAVRRVDTGSLGMGHLSAKDASKLLTDEIMKRAGVADDPEYRNIANEWSDSRQFIARPHVAVWATAPYLHNGSVPNLYELLSPVEKRHGCFYLSPNMEFDPHNVGFAVEECNDSSPRDSIAGFEFNTALPGNGNRGHEFRGEGDQCEKDGVLGCEIAPENRLAIIEYLKTCDLDRLVLKDFPLCQDPEWLDKDMRRQSAAGEP